MAHFFVDIHSLHLQNSFIKGTTGAGDAFCTGVLYGAYKDKSLAESIKLGIGCAAASLSEVNATDGVRSIYEVLNLYKQIKYSQED